MKVVVNDPKESADAVPTSSPSNATVMLPWLAENPSPLTVACDPTLPWDMETETLEVTVNVALTVPALTVCEPSGDLGTTKLWVHDPFPVLTDATVVLPYVMLIEVFGAKFDPDTVTVVAPGSPRIGEIEMLGGAGVGVWAHTEAAGNTASSIRKMNRIRNIYPALRYLKPPTAWYEGPIAVIANRKPATTG